MIKGHRIKRKVNIKSFLDLMSNYAKSNIKCTDHTFFRLSEKQRKIFKCENIQNYLLSETPNLVGMQYNGCYAVFYKYNKRDVIRIMLNISLNDIKVVTFYIIDESQVPKIK